MHHIIFTEEELQKDMSWFEVEFAEIDADDADVDAQIEASLNEEMF